MNIEIIIYCVVISIIINYLMLLWFRYKNAMHSKGIEKIEGTYKVKVIEKEWWEL